MSIVWGAPGTHDLSRVGIALFMPTSTTVAANYYYDDASPGYNDEVRLSESGAYSGTDNYWFSSNPSQLSPYPLASHTITVVPGGTYTFAASASYYVNGTSFYQTVTVSGVSITVPVTAPAAPGAPTITRTSDTLHTVAWTLNATSSAPYDSQQVQRSMDGGSYVTVATVSGTTTSYSDTATSADHRYTWQVVAVNGAGTATSAASAAWQTTPAAPSGVTAARTPAGDVLVSWADNTSLTATTSIAVDHSADGGSTWTNLTTTVAGTATSYTHVAPSTSTAHTYRVHAVSAVGATLDSAWAVSNTIPLPAPPNAPTGLAPNGGTVDLALDQSVAWSYNSADDSPQSGFEVQHRVVGGSTWATTGQTTGTVSAWTLPGGTYTNGGTVEYQVRTWGQLTASADASPWSASATLIGSSTPTVTISSPAAGTITGLSSATVTWAYYQAESVAQAAWQVTLLDSTGAVLSVTSGTGATSAVTLDGFANGSSYTIQVAVRSGVGLWSATVQVAVSFSFAPPAPIDVAPVFDVKSGAVVLTLTPQAYDGTTTLQQIGAYIERSTDGGVSWQRLNLVALDPAATVLDTTAPVDGSARYRVVALSVAPSQATGAPMQVDSGSSGWCYLSQSASTGYDNVVRFYGAASTKAQTQLDQAQQQFEGRPLPVLYSGTAIASALAVAGILTDDSSTPNQLLAIAKLPGPWLWRDPSGRVFYAGLTGMSVDQSPPNVTFPVAFTLSEVDH